MRNVLSVAAALAALSLSSNASATTFVVKAEDPGAVSSTAVFDYYGVESFNGWDTGTQTRTSTFNDTNSSATGASHLNSGSPITGTYTNVNVIGADSYGGASNSGNYAVVGLTTNQSESRSYEVTFSQTGATGLNYFGYWLSALDGGNSVSFYSGATELFTFNAQSVTNFLQSTGMYGDYLGNPFTAENGGEPYAFLNFYAEDGTFDRVVFTQAPGGAGYESDNHTVGFYSQQGGGTVIPGVPEPSTWALLILGFGVTGGAMRQRRSKARTSLAFA